MNQIARFEHHDVGHDNAYRSLASHQEAMTPIIGTVLLIGMTVVLASVMFIWVTSFSYERSIVPSADLSVTRSDNNTAVFYNISINAFRPAVNPNDVKCYIFSEQRGTVEEFRYDTQINSFSGVKGTGIELEWLDNDYNNKVTSYDSLIFTVNKTRDYLAYRFVIYDINAGSLITEVLLPK